jgi:hypothetical protein
MAQYDLDDGRVMFGWGRVRVPSGIVVALMVGTMKIMGFSILMIARWFDGGDSFYSDCMR